MNSMVGDIVERDSSASAPAEPRPRERAAPARKRWGERRRPIVLDPSARPAAAGPRTPRPQSGARAPQSDAGAPPSARAAQDPPLSDAERMHLENIRRMQQMTPEQIAHEREEIFRTMDPNVLQSLLRRAELKEQEQEAAIRPAPAGGPAQPPASAGKPASGPRASESGPGAAGSPGVRAEDEKEQDHGRDTRTAGVFESQRLSKGATLDESEIDELLGANAPMSGAGAAATAPAPADAPLPPEPAESTVHFPPPPEELRKYFPDLPVETEKLAWMQPIADDEEQEYSDQLVSVAPSELRFDFNGNVVTPRVSRLIDPSRGLHHHGDAPSAAGYTLPELAHLSRSSHSAQRAMAIQTAGRVLHKFRLRKFAKSSELQEGLQRLIAATRIMETLAEAADERTRSLTVRTYATEALWLANTGAAPAASAEGPGNYAAAANERPAPGSAPAAADSHLDPEL